MASPPNLNGKELQKAIISLARLKGWTVCHFPTVQDFKGTWRTPIAADGRGHPDLMLYRERPVAIEVKGDGDRLRPDQATWLEVLAVAGVEVHVIRPQEWRDGTVDRILT